MRGSIRGMRVFACSSEALVHLWVAEPVVESWFHRDSKVEPERKLAFAAAQDHHLDGRPLA
jgi:hypothetical protein